MLTTDERRAAALALERISDAGGTPVTSETTSHLHVHLRPRQPESEALQAIPWCRRKGRIPHKTRGGRTTKADAGWREASLAELASLPICSECDRGMTRYIRHRG